MSASAGTSRQVCVCDVAGAQLTFSSKLSHTCNVNGLPKIQQKRALEPGGTGEEQGTRQGKCVRKTAEMMQAFSAVKVNFKGSVDGGVNLGGR